MVDLVEELIARAGRAQHVLVLGAQAPVGLEEVPGWTFVRVHCDGPESTWGPLEQARQRVEARLGRRGAEGASSLDELIQLRQRLLDGDTPEHSASMVFVEALNRLARAAERRAALILDAVDAADAATREAFEELARDPRLELPLIVTARVEPGGEPPPIVESLREAWGEEAVIDLTRPTGSAPPFAWGQLERDQLLTARACAAVGDVFEVALVAQLLDRGELEILHTLQAIADTGAPVIDRGAGQLAFPQASLATLREGILPSLASHWSQRLATIVLTDREAHDGAGAPESVLELEDEALFVEESDARSPQDDGFAEVFQSEHPRDRHLEQELTERIAQAGLEGLEHLEGVPLGDEALEEGLPTPGQGDHVRAAEYLRSAGRVEEAVGHLLTAARQIASRRDAPRALLIARRALALIESVPSTEPARKLRARVLAEIGRIQARGAVVGPPFSLPEALTTVEQALEILDQDRALALRAEILCLRAGICYDIGDEDSLGLASESLTQAARLFSQAGASVDAARLLNDQAAVLVRFGDPVQAVYLLERSRHLFEDMHRRHPDDEVAARELAQTHHLLARMPTNAPIRPGQEHRANEAGLAHARRALSLYQSLGDARALGRVWETMGRLELNLEQHDLAEDYLSRALLLQRRLGDVIGVARTSAALSELLLMRDEHEDALALLAESASHNARKGSPRGLVFNIRALDDFAQAIIELDPARVAAIEPRLAELDDFLSQVAEDLGLVSVSGPRR